MLRKKSGFSTQILAEQPKVVAIHCQGHSLSLSVKSITKVCDVLHDVILQLYQKGDSGTGVFL